MGGGGAHFRGAHDIFAELFGGGNPFGMGGMGGGGDEFFFGGGGGMGGMPFGMGGMPGMPGMGGGRRSARPAAPRKAAAIEQPLACSLEELYGGSTRKMKISRTTGSGRAEEILEIQVRAGRRAIRTAAAP